MPAFMQRALVFLAGKAGIRQIIDIGPAFPRGKGNVHEVAGQIAPGTRIVYVDKYPIVLAHARALMASHDGLIDYLDADLRDTQPILDQAAGSWTSPSRWRSC